MFRFALDKLNVDSMHPVDQLKSSVCIATENILFLNIDNFHRSGDVNYSIYHPQGDWIKIV